jgi:hypothetical protein
MILPVAIRRKLSVELHDGVQSTTTEVWVCSPRAGTAISIA